ncbi:MAG: metabolite traffic protein EboE [Akkermansiaceae bacterium]
MLEHLCYCTNIHPAESWQETLTALKKHTLTVRDKVLAATRNHEASYPIGLRLSARAAEELLQGENLADFKYWLYSESLYVYTINGFPYGAFHNTRVKENVYKPDWTTDERLTYTADLISIIAELAPNSIGGSVSTLPGSFKEFQADENKIFANLYATARLLETLSALHEKDLHLGLEPEPLGHFENTEETLAFFKRFTTWATNKNLPTEIIYKRLGINYDTCHFALQYEEAATALNSLTDAGLRISKVHLSNALEIDLTNSNNLNLIAKFDEPTYLHQVMIQDSTGKVTKHKDIEDALSSDQKLPVNPLSARVHFHIPLHADPQKPFSSTIQHTIDTLHYLAQHPHTCSHLEMETYTWGVLPDDLQAPIEDQLTAEHLWVLETATPPSV